MHWTVADVEDLPLPVYHALLAWVEAQADERRGDGEPTIDLG